MSINLQNAIVYDIETFPNCFTFAMEMLNSDFKAVWEISPFKDDRQQLLAFFRELSKTQTPMIGYNNINFDYPVLHYLWNNPSATYEQLYEKAMSIIESQDRFGHTIWASDRFAPQIDVYKMHHFDNRAKATSLKTLQINMRVESVVDMPIKVGTILTKEQIDKLLIPYNMHDVEETKRFCQYAEAAFTFRNDLVGDFGVDVFNWNDTKIGEKNIIAKIGEDVCFDRGYGKKTMRQSPRSKIALKDVIFPYVNLTHPEFKRIYDYMHAQVLTSDDIHGVGDTTTIKTKGVFAGLNCNINDVKYSFGVGGIHGSVERKRVEAGNGFIIVDIDVGSLYPSIAIENGLYPEHLGQRFVEVYAGTRAERKAWQKKAGKKCTQANALKLALNGAYGKSNSKYSCLYDPKFTMSITVNGQLMLAMLIEELIKIPNLYIIQANTDGITYYIHESYQYMADEVCKKWEALTNLVLERADYSKMFIRDVNNYIAVGVDGKRKLKGAYWTPDPKNYHKSIATSQPPAWHKNFSNVASVRAAVANMIDGVGIEEYLKTKCDMFDFCCAVKVGRKDNLMWGNTEVQRNTRYFIATEGSYLKKLSPPTKPEGTYKKKPRVTDVEYNRIMEETGGEWDARVCTGNKSKYVTRETSIASGYKVIVCNDIKDFDWSKVDWTYYIEEAKKLLI